MTSEYENQPTMLNEHLAAWKNSGWDIFAILLVAGPTLLMTIILKNLTGHPFVFFTREPAHNRHLLEDGSKFIGIVA